MTRLVLAGDVMLGRGVDEALTTMRPSEVWGDLLPHFRDADARIVNLECALTRSKRRWERAPKVFHFRAAPSAVAVLQAAGIDACSLANNHVLDFEEVGLLETLDTLDRAGIRHAGAGRDLAAARRPALIAGGRVALLSITDNEPGFAAEANRPGVNFFATAGTRALDWIERAAASARRAGAEIVVLASHWGPNMVMRPAPEIRALARGAIERGVDVYFGHSAHVAQGVEIHDGKPILYDTGDFVDDYAVDPGMRNDWSFLFRLDFDGRRFERLEMVPAALSYARTKAAAGAEAELMRERMAGLCAELGTTPASRGGRLIVAAPPSAPAPR
jgi:poly-gamma-glutamate synthesis protein (capsule biosynthesis protein)